MGEKPCQGFGEQNLSLSDSISCFRAAQKAKFQFGRLLFYHASEAHMLSFPTLFSGGHQLRLLKNLSLGDGL